MRPDERETAFEAERSVLSCILLSCADVPPAMDLLRPEDFLDRRHMHVFIAMADLAGRDEPIDVVTVLAALREEAIAPKTGWAAYLSELADYSPTAANVEHYTQIVRREARRREFVALTTTAVTKASVPGADADEVFTSMVSDLGQVAEGRDLVRPVSVRDIVRTEFASVQTRAESGDSVTGLRTGFPHLDTMLGGLPNSLVLIVFSLEMSREEYGQAAMASEAKINLQRLRNGTLGDHEWPALTNASDRLSGTDCAIVDKPALDVSEVRSITRQYASRHKLGLVVVDYLQLMQARADSREQEVAAISRGLHALARELCVPVIALSQLNRGLESRGDKRPMLSDLRESGSLEQDAHQVLFIYRDDYYNTDSKQGGTAEIAIAKNRNGPTGMVRLKWIGSCTRFESFAPPADFGGPRDA